MEDMELYGADGSLVGEARGDGHAEIGGRAYVEERTCSVRRVPVEFSSPDYRLSCCGFDLDDLGEHYVRRYGSDVPLYCPRCGARVVS